MKNDTKLVARICVCTLGDYGWELIDTPTYLVILDESNRVTLLDIITNIYTSSIIRCDDATTKLDISFEYMEIDYLNSILADKNLYKLINLKAYG